MNELAKNNRLNHRYSHDELIIKRGIFMLPNSYLVFNDSSKILFRDNENQVDEDINLKIINLVKGAFKNLDGVDIDKYDSAGNQSTITITSLEEMANCINENMSNFNDRINALETVGGLSITAGSGSGSGSSGSGGGGSGSGGGGSGSGGGGGGSGGGGSGSGGGGSGSGGGGSGSGGGGSGSGGGSSS